MMCWKKQATPAESKASNVAEKENFELVLVFNSVCICFLQACVILRNRSVLFILRVPLWFIFIASHGIMLVLQSSSHRSRSSNDEFESGKEPLQRACYDCWNLKG